MLYLYNSCAYCDVDGYVESINVFVTTSSISRFSPWELYFQHDDSDSLEL